MPRVGKDEKQAAAVPSATESADQAAAAPVEQGDPDEALAGILAPRGESRWAYVEAVLAEHGVEPGTVEVQALLPDLLAVLVMADPDAARDAIASGGTVPLHTETVVAELHADNVWTAIAHASATGRCNCRYMLRRLAPLFGRTVDESYEAAGV